MMASTGTYAELTVNDARHVHTLPPALSFAQGAAVGVPCSTAWRALFQKAGAVTGETVLIHGGSGSVGTAAIQLARAAGLTVIATAGSARAWRSSPRSARTTPSITRSRTIATSSRRPCREAPTSSSRCWPT